MKVGLVIYSSLDTLSGGYLYDRKLVEYLCKQGDQVEIISLPWRNYLLHLGDNLSNSVLQRLKQLRLDILLQDELNHPSLFFTNRRLRRQVAYPVITIVHHLLSSEARPEWQNRLYRQVERSYLKSVDGFIFNSQTTLAAVQSLVNNGRPGVVAFPAGDRLKPAITDDQITARAREPGPLRIFFLGNIIPRKGLHDLLEAVRHLPDETCVVTVAGSLEMDRTYAESIRKQVSVYGMDSRVHFTGPLKETDLTRQLRSNHILAVPSLYEGFGIAYLEGMGFGLPAIASTAGAAREIITPGQDGYLVQPGDIGDLSRRIQQLTEDREFLLALSLNARRRFAAHPTWEETGETIRRFLLNFIKFPAPPA